MNLNSKLGLIFFLALKGFRQHMFGSLVAAFSIALAGGLLLGTLKIQKQTKASFNNASGGFDAVLGARGSKLQLVLNALFHLDSSPGNLSWEQYELIKNTPGVKEAYPIAVGDNYLGYRLVGTHPQLFYRHEWKKGEKYKLQSGRVFSEMAKEALVGSFVAERLKLKIGDRFQPYHGLNFKEDAQHQDVYVVVGLLEATGTPSDKVIWVPIKGIQLMEGHDAEMAKSVSAVLLSLRGATGFNLEIKYNRQGNQATFAWPVAATLASFFEKMNWFRRVLEVISYVIAVVGILMVSSTMRSSINERKRDFAILRSLGSSRMVVTGVILGHTFIISLLGAVSSIGIMQGIWWVTESLIVEETGVLLGSVGLGLQDFGVLAGVVVTGLLGGLWSAAYVYRSDLARNLQPTA
ncbi:MAG: ABC transporter permease [Verrucomicrobiota bacterium]|nr:ABC transporter permease [Verrucomicrobiota bacterium]